MGPDQQQTDPLAEKRRQAKIKAAKLKASQQGNAVPKDLRPNQSRLGIDLPGIDYQTNARTLGELNDQLFQIVEQNGLTEEFNERVQRNERFIPNDGSYATEQERVDQIANASLMDVLQPQGHKPFDHVDFKGQGPVSGRVASAMDGAANVTLSFPWVTDYQAKHALGAVGGLSKDEVDYRVDNRMRDSLEQNPLSTRLGQGAAYAAASGPLIAQGATRLGAIGAATAQKLAPQLGQAGRYGARLLAGGIPLAAEGALFGATTEADNKATELGIDAPSAELRRREGTIGGLTGLAGNAALSALYRGGRAAVTQGANQVARSTGQMVPFENAGFVPTNVMDEVESLLSGVTTGTQGGVNLLETVTGNQIDKGTFSNLRRILMEAGVPGDEIVPGLERIRNNVLDFSVNRPQTQLLADDFIDLIANEYAKNYPQVPQKLRSAIYAATTRPGSRARSAFEQRKIRDNTAGRQQIENSAYENISPRVMTDELSDIQGIKNEISASYNKILSGQIPDEDLRVIIDTLNDPFLQDDINSLKKLANSQQLTLSEFITQKPAEALHWVQSGLRKNIQRAGANTKGSDLDALRVNRGRMIEALERLDGYRNARLRWGDVAEPEEGLKLGKRFIGAIDNETDRTAWMQQYGDLSEEGRAVADISMRDKILQKATSNLEPGERPRLKFITSENAKGAFDDFGETSRGRGMSQFRHDAEQVRNRFRINDEMDGTVGSQTAERIEGNRILDKTVGSPVSRFFTDLEGGDVKNVFQKAAARVAKKLMPGNADEAADDLVEVLLTTLNDVSPNQFNRQGTANVSRIRADLNAAYSAGDVAAFDTAYQELLKLANARGTKRAVQEGRALSNDQFRKFITGILPSSVRVPANASKTRMLNMVADSFESSSGQTLPNRTPTAPRRPKPQQRLESPRRQQLPPPPPPPPNPRTMPKDFTPEDQARELFGIIDDEEAFNRFVTQYSQTASEQDMIAMLRVFKIRPWGDLVDYARPGYFENKMHALGRQYRKSNPPTKN